MQTIKFANDFKIYTHGNRIDFIINYIVQSANKCNLQFVYIILFYYLKWQQCAQRMHTSYRLDIRNALMKHIDIDMFTMRLNTNCLNMKNKTKSSRIMSAALRRL